jgi:hypothetical protein
MINKSTAELFEFKLMKEVTENDFIELATKLFKILQAKNIAQMELYKASDDLWVTLTRYPEMVNSDESWGALQAIPEFKTYLSMIDTGNAKALFLKKLI